MKWLELIKQFLATIPIFDRWFTKTASEKLERDRKKTRRETDDFKEGGRPKWHD